MGALPLHGFSQLLNISNILCHFEFHAISRKSQQPFRPNPNGAGDRTTTLRRLLIGVEDHLSRIQPFSGSADSHIYIFFSLILSVTFLFSVIFPVIS